MVLLLNINPTQAQNDEIPLSAPYVMVTPATTDRILIYDMNGVQRELSFGGFEHHIWDTSPDGCQILFTLAQTGQPPQMYTANLDGSNQRQLVMYEDLPASEWGIWEPDWSPDGARIAFTMIRNIPQRNEIVQEHHIGWINGLRLDEPQTPEFYSVTGREYTPQWSPDSEWLAYVSYDERVVGVDPASTAIPTQEPVEGQTAPEVELPTVFEADLWVVSADGVTKYPLTQFSVGSVRHPRWSPDSDLIGFIYSPSSSNDTFFMIGNQQGSIATQLSFQWNLTLDHTWLPDGSAMLASVRDFQQTGGNRLWRIPLIGNADNDATFFLTDNAFTHTDYPRFSADGRWLAFRSTYILTVVDTQSSTWVQLDDTLPGNTPPVWSPAGFDGEQGCIE